MCTNCSSEMILKIQIKSQVPSSEFGKIEQGTFAKRFTGSAHIEHDIGCFNETSASVLAR